ncbi:MAG: hypothetical protein GY842_25465 [bacterium]|nr:hypothetical protein [bacterium]
MRHETEIPQLTEDGECLLLLLGVTGVGQRQGGVEEGVLGRRPRRWDRTGVEQDDGADLVVGHAPQGRRPRS